MANLIFRRIGDLDCHVITSDPAPQLVAVFCHGFGAPGDDLVPVGAQILTAFPSLLDRLQLVFPCAPLPLEDFPAGRAWWPLDIERLIRSFERGDLRESEAPPLLPQARGHLLTVIEELQSETELPAFKLVLGGFSQGSMLAIDVALRLPQPPGGLVIWSGMVLNAEEWSTRIGGLRNVPVIQSHGREDAILPFEAGKMLRDLLLASGADLNFIPFHGPHTIPQEAILATGALCERLLGDAG